MTLNDACARGFLLFSQIYTIVGVLSAGFFSRYRNKFVTLAILATSCIVINTALKGFFKVPLHPSITHFGYAFPSGHMQFATLFWTAFAYELKDKKAALPLLLLPGIGWGLINFDYHTLSEVIAGFVVGLAWLGFSIFCRQRTSLFIPLFFIVTTAAILYDFYTYPIFPMYALQSYCIFLSLILFVNLLPSTQSGGILKD